MENSRKEKLCCLYPFCKPGRLWEKEVVTHIWTCVRRHSPLPPPKKTQNTGCPGRIVCYERYFHISQIFLPIPTSLLLHSVFSITIAEETYKIRQTRATFGGYSMLLKVRPHFSRLCLVPSSCPALRIFENVNAIPHIPGLV